MRLQAFPVRGSGGYARVGEVHAVPPRRTPQGEALPPAAGDVPLLSGEKGVEGGRLDLGFVLVWWLLGLVWDGLRFSFWWISVWFGLVLVGFRLIWFGFDFLFGFGWVGFEWYGLSLVWFYWIGLFCFVFPFCLVLFVEFLFLLS